MTVKVGINGYGTIGKRVADAVSKMPDMELVGVAKITPDYGALIARSKGYRLYTLSDRLDLFRKKGIEVDGTIEDLLSEIDVIIDTTPGGYGLRYKGLYRKYSVKMIFQGGEKPEVADISFNTLCNYRDAIGRESVRVVSCNTTGLLRLICTLNSYYPIERVRAIIIRRAADPKEIKRGPVNAIVPSPISIPSHHGIDVKTVLPWLDIITSAVIVPTTLMHVHIVNIWFKEKINIEYIIEALEHNERIALIDSKVTGIKSTAEIVEVARDLGRYRYDVPELIVWKDSLYVNGRELMLIQAVHQESIVVPENIDAIRALMRIVDDPMESFKLTNKVLGIRGRLI